MKPGPTLSPGMAGVLRRSAQEPVWLRVGAVFDGYMTLEDAHLVFDAATIRHVGPALPAPELVRPGQIAPDLVLPGHTVLPGLVEAHAHFFLEGGERDPERRAAYLKQSGAELLARAEARLERLLRIGICGVREAGDRHGVGLALQRRYRSDARGAMPYMDCPGAALHHQGRYGSFMGGTIEAHGTIEAAVRARADEGAHRIKLLATGVINFEKGAVTAPPQMTAEELTRAVTTARTLGKQTMIHCSGHEGVANCIAAGVDTIEHGFFVDETQLTQMRDRDIAWVPTFAPVQFQVDHAAELGWNDTVRDNLRRILDAHAASLARADQIGVRIIAGSDAGSHGVPHGHGFLWELELMARAGLSAPRILAAATGESAARLGFAEDFGVLRRGHKPRLLLTSATVLEDVRALRAPLITVFDGRVYEGGDDVTVPGL